MRDPYSVLGVKRDAGVDEIKAAWRSAAKAAHPDQNRDDPDATKKFAELGRAYDVLKDPSKRSRYDMQREKADARKREQTIQQQREAAREAAEKARAARAKAEELMADLARNEAAKAKTEKPKPGAEKPAGAQTAGTAAPDEVLSQIFGDTPEANAAAENMRRETVGKTIEPEDGAAAAKQSDKHGEKHHSLLDPLELFGALLRKIRGSKPVTEKAPDLPIEATVTIDDLLKGAAVTVALPEGRQVRFALDAGLSEGSLVRLKGQGLSIPGMQRGDVIVTVKIARDPVFSVDGYDIHTVLPVTLEHAVLGYTTKVNTPEGEAEVEIPAWSGSDQKIRLEDRGLRNNTGGRGALVVELRVMLWEKPDDKVTDLMRMMREGLYL